MTTFAQKLDKRSRSINSFLCVGIDPHLNDLNDLNDLNGADVSDLLLFCKSIIDETFHVALAYKPNIAFFEYWGHKGLKVLEELVAYIREKGRGGGMYGSERTCDGSDGPLIILDCKRGDIGSTAEAYARAYFDADKLDVDAVTLSPYMGSDSIDPFVSQEYM